MTLSNDNLIAVLRGMLPILAQRVKWYQDPDFNPAARKWWKRSSLRQRPSRWKLLLAVILFLAMILWGLATQK